MTTESFSNEDFRNLFGNKAEEVKSFVDDMRDEAILNLARRPYDRYALNRTTLRDKHGTAMHNLTPDEMWAIGRYCQYLIEVGAVKITFPASKETVEPIHIDQLTYWNYNVPTSNQV